MIEHDDRALVLEGRHIDASVHTLADLVEEATIVEAAGAAARLIAEGPREGETAAEHTRLVEMEARNFARALRGELRTFRSTIGDAVYDGVVSVLRDGIQEAARQAATEALVKAGVVPNGNGNGHVDDLVGELHERAAATSNGAERDPEGVTYRYGGRLLYRGPCKGGCGTVVRGVPARGRTAGRCSSCRNSDEGGAGEQ